MQEFRRLVHEWETFYLLLGTAGATLAGLMFVALTVSQQMQPIPRERMPLLRALSDPALLAFVLNLTLSAVLLMPTLTRTGFGTLLLAIGLADLLYSSVILRRLSVRRQHFKWDLADRTWYFAAPVLSGVLLLVAGWLGLSDQGRTALTVVAATLLLLLAMGIRNAWDLVTFAIARTAGTTGAEGQDNTPPS